MQQRTSSQVLRVVGQLLTYHVYFNCKYGIIYTYLAYWFVRTTQVSTDEPVP